jgi:hypothetical protein
MTHHLWPKQRTDTAGQCSTDLPIPGPLLVVVNRPATIGALPVAAGPRQRPPLGAYRPGLAMSRVADLLPGRA